MSERPLIVTQRIGIIVINAYPLKNIRAGEPTVIRISIRTSIPIEVRNTVIATINSCGLGCATH